jgi:tRNA modification GTPase
MPAPTNDTIFALSSGRPPAAIAVVRISGPRAGHALKILSGKVPAPRQAALARLRDPASGEIVDEALALWFPAPHSETGEDIAELQLHGGRAVIAAVLGALSRIEGLRPAEAGEFTRRAFENGKLDLTAVEGLADLVMAETQAQRRQAFRQMKGLLGAPAENWRQRLIQALALVEARIDFSDEADVPQDLLAPALAIARELEGEIAAALADGGRGERLREGLVVAIAGPPNAGKSTLLNRIARREAAIVSPYAGTTRDVIEVHLDLAGWPVTLLDTAGIRETDDPVELEGVRRARERAAAADLVLWVMDAREATGAENAAAPGAAKIAAKAAAWGAAISNVIPGREPTGPREARPDNKLRERTRNPEFHPVAPGFRAPATQVGFSRPGETGIPISGKPEIGRESRNDDVVGPPTWLIRNKIDLMRQEQRNERSAYSIGMSEAQFDPTKPLTSMVKNKLIHRSESKSTRSELEFTISAVTGEGFDLLLGQLARQAEEFLSGAESALITRERHRHALDEVLAALRRAQSGEVACREDLLAEELRIAARALGRLTGRVDVEDILDVIFRDFCIGK